MMGRLVLLFSVLLACDGFHQKHGYKLKKVLVMSRHNLRTPVSKDVDKITAKPWPHYKEKPGMLTEKGAVLEGYIAVFLTEWLRSHSILTKDCPSTDEIHVYTNVMQRTKATGQAFVDYAFPGCDVPVHFSKAVTDKIFFPVLHNSTEAYKTAALKLMYDKVGTLRLTDSFTEMNNILNYSDSYNCKYLKHCDLSKDQNTIVLEKGVKPAIFGPLKYGNIATDAFIMAYFNGLPLEDVGWGLLTEEKWQKFLLIMRGYHHVFFGIPSLAKDMGKYLLQYLKEQVLSERPKFNLMVGHDSNIYILSTVLRFKPYSLPDQFEDIPIGGKIVFQKWFDEINGQNLLKINYVYQTNEQLRNNATLSADNPPGIIELELEGCRLNENGYCLWEDFVTLLNDLYN